MIKKNFGRIPRHYGSPRVHEGGQEVIEQVKAKRGLTPGQVQIHSDPFLALRSIASHECPKSK